MLPGLCTSPSPPRLAEVCVHLLKMVTVNVKGRTWEIGQNQREISQHNESEAAFLLDSVCEFESIFRKK